MSEDQRMESPELADPDPVAVFATAAPRARQVLRWLATFGGLGTVTALTGGGLLLLAWFLVLLPVVPLSWEYVGEEDRQMMLDDRPLPNDPSTACHDDGYYSVANFTAYAGSVAVDRQTRTANNASVSFQFTLGGTSTTTVIDRIVVQVCRHPLVTLPPSYCGKAVTYLAPPTA